MAEEQKPVEIAPEATAPVEIPAETTIAPVEDKAVEETKPTEEPTEEPTETKAEEKKDEVTPIEEGHLSHKAQGLSFPKNLIPSKEFFFFGNEAVEPKLLSAYKKAEKSAETAYTNIAWAAHTGKGLLFVGDKKSPSGVINLSDATEPETDGSNKFHLTSKGNKHSFKAANTADRDNWVAQLKLKIAEAKEIVGSVTESEIYKTTIESFKPAPKEEKPAEAPKEEAAKAEESAAAEEPAKEEETAKEEAKTEEAKRKKRASFFGFGKKEEKKEETKEEPKADETAVVAAAEGEAVAEAEPVPAEESKPAEEAAVAEDKPAETPKASKRNSFFGGVFSKKEKKAETKPEEAAEAAQDDAVSPAAEAEETAPVIPPVETTTPLTAEVAPEIAAAEDKDAVPATNGETKKDVKEKRKSSLPFNFGKREKSPAPAEGEEKAKGGAFSKLRATIKGKSSSPKTEDKVEDKTAEEETKEEAPVEAAAPSEEPVQVVEPEVENKPESVAAAAPVVTAAA